MLSDELTWYDDLSSKREFIQGANYRFGANTGQEVRRGGRIKPEVSWTSDTCVGWVSGVVDLFRTTFVFRINSSGHCSSAGQIIGLAVRRGMVRCSVC